MSQSSTLSNRQLTVIAWSLVVIANTVALLLGAQQFRWQFDTLSAYTVFPLLGLVAFSTMWAQYMAGAIRRMFHIERTALRPFSEATGWVVTTAILLHPSLLIWQLWRDGAGPPPQSYIQYVPPGIAWAVLLGTFSLLIFLAFELRRRYRDRSWWRYVDLANDLAIIAIYVHAFVLTSHERTAAFFGVWIFFGLTLSTALLYKYLSKEHA